MNSKTERRDVQNNESRCEKRRRLSPEKEKTSSRGKEVNGRHMTRVPSVLSTHPLDNMISTMEEILGPTEITHTNLKTSSDEFERRPSLNPAFPLPVDTYEFLDRKGAFTIPVAAVRGEMLAAYVKWIHPLCPIVDLADFLHDIVSRPNGEFPSPLLYQAVLLAGSAFVDDSIVEQSGYASRKEMRKSLFEKSKWLYTLETELDAVRQIQALLLMTFWHEIDNDTHKDPDHWLSLAHSKSQETGICPPFDRHQIPSVSFQRRLWSCIYLRDRLISLAIRRPPHIQDNTSPMTETQDLYTETYGNNSLDIESALPPSAAKFLTPQFQAHSNLLYIEKIKLATCIGTILTNLFQLSSTHNDANSSSPSLTLIPAHKIPEPAVSKCRNLLRSWFDRLPGAAHFYPPFPDVPLDSDSASTVLLIHQADLYLLYLAATAAFHLCLRSDELAESILRSTATGITKTITELRAAGLELYLPATAITVLIFATGTHLLDLASGSGLAYSESLDLLKECTESAKGLSQIYSRASLVVSITSAGLRKYSRNAGASAFI